MKNCACSACHIEESADCGGGHDHHHEHGDNGKNTIKRDLTAIGAALALCGLSFAVPDGILRTSLLIAAVLIAGAPVFWHGLKSIAKLDFEETALLTIAVTAAALIGELPEAIMVTVLFRAGEMLEDLAVQKSRRQIEAVTNIIPDNANLIAADGSVSTVSAKSIASGDKILLKSGERVPVDCIILSGESMIDPSSLTGESVPREVAAGDELLSGTVNLGGVLTCEATSAADNSMAAKIIAMVRDSAAKKGQTERMISRFARIYTPCVIIAAVMVAVLPPLLGFGAFSVWISRSLVFLVASCPCALVIGIPLAFFAGMGGASRQGILIKGSKYMEVLAKTKAVAFDKTGTLTTGRLTVDGIFATDGHSQEEVMRLAAVCERTSNHPVAKAISEAAPEIAAQVESCEEITAYGMKATIDGEEILCGSKRLMERYGVDVSGLPDVNVYVAKNKVAIGAVSVADTPRVEAAEAIAELKREGVEKTAMLTGDSKKAAQKAAEAVGIREVHAGLLPGDKVAAFTTIRAATGGKALFVGDGINDAPVIAAADAGVAMGMGSDTAIEAADVALLSGSLSSLPKAIRISKRTMRLAGFNIAFALVIKLVVLVLAFFGVAGMWLAVFADVGVAILSVLNAARALRFN